MAEEIVDSAEQAASVDSPETLDPIQRLNAVLESETEQPGGEEESEDQEESQDSDSVDQEFEQDADESEAVEEVEEDDPTDDSEEETVAETFDVDGESLTIEELKLGWLRQSDYTKKTQTLSEGRKANEAQSEQTHATMNALLAASGADLSRFEGVNWERVAVENPDGYQQAKANFEQTKSTYDYIKAQADQYQTQEQQREDNAQKEAAQESLTVLKTNIPNWSNETYYQIRDYAQDGLGVSGDEFNKVADHRLITALYKAMQYDQQKTVAIKKKLKSGPSKTLSGGKAGTAKVSESETSRKTRERLRKTGKVADAAAAILNRMN